MVVEEKKPQSIFATSAFNILLMSNLIRSGR